MRKFLSPKMLIQALQGITTKGTYLRHFCSTDKGI
jgi:hypothetical protein